MKIKKIPYLKFPLVSIICILVFLTLSCTVYAKATECDTTSELCKITITLNLAFSYNNSEISAGKINNWANDIETVWNGPNGYQTTGDCKCEVRFKVKWQQITDPSQVNCNPGPPDHHCIMITVYNKNPPRNQTPLQGAETYRGYMYNPSTGGASTNGWWSDIMNDPHPTTGGNCHDAAHEAGHMMGLDDKEGDGLMTHTSGDNAKPTQKNIDDAVKNVCGENACPDYCCCGNGEIESDKGEECDPFASPIGCMSGEACCPVCCGCYLPYCIPQNGEYYTTEDCQKNCRTGFKCYQNYQTGCWDCVETTVVVEQEYSDTFAREMKECPHSEMEANLNEIKGIISLEGLPDYILGIFGNEKINIYIEGMPEPAFIVLSEGEIIEIGMGEYEGKTMNVYTDLSTIDDLAKDRTDFVSALEKGRITYEGVGLLNSLKFGVQKIFFDILSVFSDLKTMIF